MLCPNCAASIEDSANFCPSCGFKIETTNDVVLEQETSMVEEPVIEEPVIEKPRVEEPVNENPKNETLSIPENLQPLGAWAYFWLSILFSIPVVGFVFLIVFSCSKGNINRRNYARSYWCRLLLVAIIFAIIFAIAIVVAILTGGSVNDFSTFSQNAMTYM